MLDYMEERLLKEYYKDNPLKMEEARKRLEAHEPLAYILGETVFYDEYYEVNPSVLIPRPDTEIVVETLLKYLKKGAYFADLCTGSGCIAISALCHSEETRALMIDKSEEALQVAKRNVQRNHVEHRAALLQMDVLSRTLPENETFDIIVSNPPYVVRKVIPTLEEECQKEPYMAFDGGEDGMDFYRRFLEECPKHLKKGGKMIFEIGYDEREKMEQLAAEHGFHLEIIKDYSKNDRVAILSP